MSNADTLTVGTQVIVRGPLSQHPAWGFVAAWDGNAFVTYDPFVPLYVKIAPAHSSAGRASVVKVHADSDSAELYLDGDIRIADFHCLADAQAFASAYNAIHSAPPEMPAK